MVVGFEEPVCLVQRGGVLVEMVVEGKSGLNKRELSREVFKHETINNSDADGTASATLRRNDWPSQIICSLANKYFCTASSFSLTIYSSRLCPANFHFSPLHKT
jgi:hypothetical protein